MTFQMTWTYICRAFYPKVADYILLSSAQKTLSRIDHMLGHRTSLDKFNKIKMVSRIFSDHNAMSLEINYKKNTHKTTNMWWLNTKVLNNQWITEEIKEEVKKKKKTN